MGRNAVDRDPVSDGCGQRRGLSGPCPRQHEDRSGVQAALIWVLVRLEAIASKKRDYRRNRVADAQAAAEPVRRRAPPIRRKLRRLRLGQCRMRGHDQDST